MDDDDPTRYCTRIYIMYCSNKGIFVSPVTRTEMVFYFYTTQLQITLENIRKLPFVESYCFSCLRSFFALSCSENEGSPESHSYHNNIYEGDDDLVIDLPE